eukprot:gene11258-4077_t
MSNKRKESEVKLFQFPKKKKTDDENTRNYSNQEVDSKKLKTKVVNVKVSYLRPKYQNLKEFCEDKNNLYIGREGIVFIEKERYPKKRSPWANPFKVDKKMTREKSIDQYETYIRKKIKNGELDLKELEGKTLGCWCKPQSCHGDTLLKLLKENNQKKELKDQNETENEIKK